MIGMPYPNPTDPELQERMRFMDAQQEQASRLAAAAVNGGAADPTSPSQAAALVSQRVNIGSASTCCALVSSSEDHNLEHQTSAARKRVTAGREYYEDLCMKAVNQCVGRVIRHRKDYAAIVLADARWCVGNAGVTPGGSQTPVGPLKKLPEWIQGSLTVCNTFGDAYGRLHRFHRHMLVASTPM